MNYQYNEVEEFLREPHGNTERHFELFRERSRTTGRLFTLTVCVAAVLLLKVLMPFQDLSERLEERTHALAALGEEATQLDQRLEYLNRVERHFGQVQTTIRRAAWSRSVGQMVGTMRQLNRSYRVLLDTSNEELDRYLKDGAPRTPEVGALLDEVGTRPAAFPAAYRQATRSKWMSPPAELEEPAFQGVDAETGTVPLTEAQLEALQGYFAALEAVRELGLLDDTIDLPSPEPAVDEQGREERELIQEPAWMNTPPPSVAESIRTLHVDPQQLLGFESFRDRDEFLFEQLQTRAREEAHKLLSQVAGEVRQTVVEPLRKTLESENAEELPHLAAGLEQLERSLDAWKSSHESDSGWYQTVAAKGQAVSDLGQSLGSVLASATDALQRQTAAIDRERADTSEKAREIAGERRVLRESRTELQGQLEGLLPTWIASFVDTSELIQVFPMLVILMVFVLVYNVWLVRDHFMLSRTPGIDGAPYTSASLWTLVHRGGFRTLTSLAVYLGGTALLWFVFEQGTILMTRWAALESTQAWTFTGWVTDAAPWFGRAVFLAAAGGVVLALLSREQPTEEPQYA